MKKITAIISLLFSVIALNAQTFEQLAKLTAADRAAGNQLGNALAISGNFAVIGASDISDGGIQGSCNCAYVFEKKSTGWVQVQKLVPSDPSARDGFAKSVSINRSYIIIGAPGNDLDDNNTNNITDAGSIYIFKRNATGSWVQDKKIVAPDRSAGDLFGTSVSIASVYDRGEGSYVLVGAPGDADWGGLPALTGAGSAYFITNLNGAWEVYHKVVPVVGTYYDRNAYAGFGTSVSISVIYSGVVISAVVGAPGEKKDTTGSNPKDAAGAAYLFKRSGSGGLELVHKIVNWDRAAGDQFGYAVSIDKNQLVVGAPFEDEDANQINTLISAGSAYVFNKMSDGNWYWVEKLIPPGRAAGDNFGMSVSISGDMIVAGAATVDDFAGDIKLNSSGAAYVFKLSRDSLSSGWRPLQKIVATDRAENDWFGYSVGIDSNNIIVGAPFQDRNDTRLIADDAGAAYFFGKKVCNATTSSISPSVCRSYTSPSKKYTWSVSGTYTDSIPNKAGCDSVITIHLTITHKVDTSVTQKGNTLTANIKNASYQWIDCKTNEPININTRTLIATVNGSYKVQIEQDGCSGVSSCYTVNPAPPVDNKPVDTMVNTTPDNTTPVNPAPESHSELREFVEINKLVPKDRQGYENFGYSVAISGDYAVIGANVDDKDANGENPISDAGSAYVFKKDKDGKWKEVQKIVASDRSDGDNFGWSVAINLNHIVVGAIYQDKDLSGNPQSSTGSGAAYVFERNENGIWVQKQKLIPNPLDGQVLFGHSVAIDGNTIAVGSPWYAKDATGKPETNLNDAGAVFVFNKIGGAWVQSQILTPAIRNINNLGDGLGWSVAICGDLIIAGAWGVDFDDKGGGTRMEASGAAYIFERSGGKWKEVQKIVAGDRAAHDQFGYSVAISGDNAIIGAWNKTETDDPNSRPHTGNAYIFSRKAAPGRVRPDGGIILTPDDGKWKQVLKINPEDRRPDDYLGWSVGMSGDYAIVSAMKQDTDSLDNLMNDGGAIYVYYQGKNGNWLLAGKLAAFDRSQLDQLGHAVAISGCDIIGGTIVDQEDDQDANALTSAGSAYVFSAADCRNVTPCYRPKVTPDIKTPLDKTGTNKSTSSLDAKNTTPQKIQSVDQNSKSNETLIQNVDLGNEGITQPVNIKNPQPKTDSVKTVSTSYDFRNIDVCIDKLSEGSLPPKPPAQIKELVPPINEDGELGEVQAIKQGLTAFSENMWNPGDIITVAFFPGSGDAKKRDSIRHYVKTWEAVANLKFDFIADVTKAIIRIGFNNDNAFSWSKLGRHALFNPFNDTTMLFGLYDFNWKDFKATVLHEFGHAIGFGHEHQSPYAGISWNKEEVYAFYTAKPTSWSRATIDQNIFAKYSATITNSSVYDTKSIMHYSIPARFTTNGYAVPKNYSLSAIDSAFAKEVYPFPPSPKDATGLLRTRDDCDEIVFTVDYNAAGVADYEIDFILEPGIDHHGNWITWWKKIGIPLKGGGEAGLEIENKSVSNRKFYVSQIDRTRGIRFWKAKFLGVHTLLNYQWNALPAITGGCRVRLTWRRDTCL